MNIQEDGAKVSPEDIDVYHKAGFEIRTLLCRDKLVILQQCGAKYNLTDSSSEEEQDRYCGKEFEEMAVCGESIEDSKVTSIIYEYAGNNCKNEKYLLEDCVNDHGTESTICHQKMVNFLLCGARGIIKETKSQV